MTSFSKRKTNYSHSKKKDYGRRDRGSVRKKDYGQRERGSVGIQERQSRTNISLPKPKKYTIYDITNIEYLLFFYKSLPISVCMKFVK